MVVIADKIRYTRKKGLVYRIYLDSEENLPAIGGLIYVGV